MMPCVESAGNYNVQVCEGVWTCSITKLNGTHHKTSIGLGNDCPFGRDKSDVE